MEKKDSKENIIKKKTSKKTIELEKYEEIAQKLEEINDKYLRLNAEFDNYRKRTLKEKIDLIKTAGEDILVNILPVIDNFERAIKANQNLTDTKAINEGISLIYNNFKEFINQKGVKEIEAIGQNLDTDLHEAITKVPVQEETQKGTIIDVIEKGYKLNDKVIRFAKVVVGE
jgi:molecular chaperone GrpE